MARGRAEITRITLSVPPILRREQYQNIVGVMDEPGPVDPEVLRRMRELIVVSIAQRNKAWMEAAAEARGLCRGMQPALPENIVDQAVGRVLRDLDLLLPQPATAAVGDRRLVAAEPLEVADSLAYAMRFDECGKARRTGVEYLAKVAAEQLVRQLAAIGFIVMRTERS